MKITAHSNAGSTECNLKFATLTYSGSKLSLLRLETPETGTLADSENPDEMPHNVACHISEMT